MSDPGSFGLAGLTCLILTDGKIGDRVQCLGVAERLGLCSEERIVRPRRPWSWFAPYGPPDPKDARFEPPYPGFAIASGRRAVPVLRALKRRSGNHTFTVCLKQPANGLAAADVIWVPEHDRLRGPNVIATLTSPSLLTPSKLSAARRAPDPRIAALPAPRVALLIGGPSGAHRFDDSMTTTLIRIVRTVLGGGQSLMVTPSRRTPPELVARLQAVASEDQRFGGRCYVWQGEEPNPYVSILALADALIVTGDSVNMMGETASTGAPVHVVEPPGRHSKVSRFIDGLVAAGAARRWSGALEHFTYQPIDATPLIAAEVAARFRVFALRTGA